MKTVLGLERLKEFDRLFRGKAIGLITNFSGIESGWEKDNLTLFAENGYHVARIFTPEHGMYGAKAGEAVCEAFSPDMEQIGVVSLYGEKKKPAPKDLEGIELLVFDIQDVGLRYYTYLYTMTYAMEAAAEAGIGFVVLDRPNPLGTGIISGPCLLPSIHSFVGDYELPMRYGMTLGETAQYYKRYAGLRTELTVIRMENYADGMIYPQTGLWWNVPSPAIPTFESAVCYHGGCLFEAVNVSEGRGSARPFLMYGAPFLDMDVLYRELTARIRTRDFVFRRRAFMPCSGKYEGEVCFGLEFLPLAEDGDFLPVALTLLKVICDCWPEQVVFRKEEEDRDSVHLKVLYGNEEVKQYLNGKLRLADLQESWREENRAFEASVRDLKLYRR